ncbi:RNA-directed DNA polymerase from transposon X-element [Clarias magur]|uniref:RNA-directed DNA polymerase from transposon X-element n=1 Tax=Clarias magur TaxID=1594786 RepID=A0A8J4WY28_CLAMG|nr:RNA-directed DNA polymerase from transposon X-element [Clarias magur]
MGNSKSKTNKGEDNLQPYKHPNVKFMLTNYGARSLSQFRMWVEDCGFPDRGSFSERQIRMLGEALKEYESDKRKKKKVDIDWVAFKMWQSESRVHAQRSQPPLNTTTKANSSLQCSKFLVDPDLDDCPLRPLVPPSPQTPPSQADLPKPEPSPPEQTDKQCPPPPPQYASMHPSLEEEEANEMRRKLRPRKEKKQELEKVSTAETSDEEKRDLNYDENSPQMPMVEVAGPDGAAVLVHRPWTTKDIEDAHRQLPDPREVGGDKFSKELVRFCREFRPTSHELRRLLMQKVSVDISRIRYQWPVAGCQRHYA